jgi:hypothetical protein
MPPRWRIAFLAAAFVSLAGGVAGGLARLTPLEVAATAIALHGALMVSAFLGSVIGLERAAALERLWVYAAPLASSLGGAALLAGFVRPGLALLVLAAAVLLAANLVVLKRHASLETATLAAGAAAWLAGNAALFHGLNPSAWWIAFFALTIGAERLELSRYLKRGAAARASFAALVLGLLVTAVLERVMGVVLAAFALWLFRFDLARITVRATRPPALRCRVPAGGVLLARGGRRSGGLGGGARCGPACRLRRLRLVDGFRPRADHPARGAAHRVCVPPGSLRAARAPARLARAAGGGGW